VSDYKPTCEQMEAALWVLHRFGLELLVSKVEDERGIGCCIVEATRILVDEPDFPPSPSSGRGE
jgi:hypothetical protein